MLQSEGHFHHGVVPRSGALLQLCHSFCQLANKPGYLWEKGISTHELVLSDWPVGMCVWAFSLFANWHGRTQPTMGDAVGSG